MNKKIIIFSLGFLSAGLVFLVCYAGHRYYQQAAARKKKHQAFINEIPNLDKEK